MFAIIGAMKKEVDEVLNLCDSFKQINSIPFNLYQAVYQEHDILICQSGIGKTEAAMTTSFLLSNFNIDLIINMGSAGGLCVSQNIGDIMIATDLMYHDLIFNYQNPLEDMEKYHFTIDNHLITKMEQTLNHLNYPYSKGKIVSGDQFVTNLKQVQLIQAKFPEAICVEMEACAIAHVCHLFNKNCVIIRALSDIAVREGNEVDFYEFVAYASKKSAQACLDFIKSVW